MVLQQMRRPQVSSEKDSNLQRAPCPDHKLEALPRQLRKAEHLSEFPNEWPGHVRVRGVKGTAT